MIGTSLNRIAVIVVSWVPMVSTIDYYTMVIANV